MEEKHKSEESEATKVARCVGETLVYSTCESALLQFFYLGVCQLYWRGWLAYYIWERLLYCELCTLLAIIPVSVEMVLTTYVYLHWPCCTISKGADGMSFNLLTELPNHVDLRWSSMTFHKTPHHVIHPIHPCRSTREEKHNLGVQNKGWDSWSMYKSKSSTYLLCRVCTGRSSHVCRTQSDGQWLW